MKALLVACFFLSTIALHAAPKPTVKKAPTPRKMPVIAKATPEKLKSGPLPDGRVIITAEDLSRSGSSTVSGALRHYPYLFIRSH